MINLLYFILHTSKQIYDLENYQRNPTRVSLAKSTARTSSLAVAQNTCTHKLLSGDYVRHKLSSSVKTQTNLTLFSCHARNRMSSV